MQVKKAKQKIYFIFYKNLLSLRGYLIFSYTKLLHFVNTVSKAL